MKPLPLACLLAPAITGLLFSHLSQAQMARSTEKDPYRNYDIRDPEIGADAAKTIAAFRDRAGVVQLSAVTRTVESMRQARAVARIPNVQLEMNRFGTSWRRKFY